MNETWLVPGAVFRIAWPMRGRSAGEQQWWELGVEQVQFGDHFVPHCDAWGEKIITVRDIYYLKGFQRRVFFQQQWRDPDGRVGGHKTLRCQSVTKFKKLLRGFRDGSQVVARTCPDLPAPIDALWATMEAARAQGQG
jgi:hypothetical protein